MYGQRMFKVASNGSKERKSLQELFQMDFPGKLSFYFSHGVQLM